MTRTARTIGWGLGIGALVVGLYGVADAQPTTPLATTATSSGNVGIRPAALPPTEMRVRGNGIVAKISVSAAGIGRQLEVARAVRDVIKSNFLNDLFSQANVALRSARERNTSLDQALDRSDLDRAVQEFTILTVLGQRVEQLVSEAIRAVGQEAGFVGDTSVTVTIDPGLPGNDDIFPPITITIVIPVPPPPASGTN